MTQRLEMSAEKLAALDPEVRKLVEAGDIAPRFYDELAGARVLHKTQNVDGSDRSPEPARWVETTKVLGAGGFGEVRLGYDARLGKEVAIKSMHGVHIEPGKEQAFIREAQVTAGFESWNVPKIYGIVINNGEVKVIMEVVQGDFVDLERKLGKLTGQQTVQAVTELCALIDRGAQKNLHHLDLKPTNIKIDDEGHIKALDFGLASLVHDYTTLPPGAGSPHYMSPERLRRNFDPQETGQISEIFTVASILYEMITGEVRFGITRTGNMEEDLVKLLQKVITSEPLTRDQEEAFIRAADNQGFNGRALLGVLNDAWIKDAGDRKSFFPNAGRFAQEVSKTFRS